MKKLDYEKLMADYQVIGMSALFLNDGAFKFENHGFIRSDSNIPVTKNTIFNTCSISKFITTLMVLIIAGNGELSLDEDVNQYLKNWRVPAQKHFKKKLTLRHLLSHQSGFTDPEGSFQSFMEEEGVPDMLSLLEGKTAYLKEPAELQNEPGDEFSYSDIGFCVIQKILEDVSGASFEALLEQTLTGPLELKQTQINPESTAENSDSLASGHDNHGKEILRHLTVYPYPAAAGIWTSAADLAVMLEEVMKAFQGLSLIGLEKELIRELIKGQGKYPYAGLGVFLDDEGESTEFSALGWGAGFQSLLALCPEQGCGLAVLTGSDSGVHQLKGFIGEVYRNYMDS